MLFKHMTELLSMVFEHEKICIVYVDGKPLSKIEIEKINKGTINEKLICHFKSADYSDRIREPK